MKKILLPLLLLSSKLVIAQLYISPYYSYSLPVLNHVIAQHYMSNPSGYWQHSMYGSFGGGNSYGGTMGYRFHNGLVGEFSAETFKSNTVTTEMHDSLDPSYTVIYNREASVQATRFFRRSVMLQPGINSH